uniref:Uncharacterized protein n=1 Tax=Oryza barthii TaxID=65489 RepID=A0A0D3FKL6_9ORYZ
MAVGRGAGGLAREGGSTFGGGCGDSTANFFSDGGGVGQRGGRQPRAGSRFRLELADEVAGVGQQGFSGDESWLVVLLLGEVVVGDMVRSFGKPQVMVNNSVVGGLIIGK